MQNPQCASCRFFRGLRECDAFGDKTIPDDIWKNKHDHREPFEGDGGVTYSANPDMEFTVDSMVGDRDEPVSPEAN